ncbi:MAG: hypothetical protein JJU29_15785 [Verrucomicrobia bacterium]|nr:hypothetical protein [Verrucomicrobiota bacterium]MCH8514320.1 hypothetical protein [Kiritimatiellia bacterium]
MKKFALFLGLALLIFAPVRADWDADWVTASAAYDNGEYAEAYALFSELRGDGKTSAALEYNLGNSALRMGRPDMAAGHYRLAQWLAPGDPDLRANYELAVDVLGAELAPLPFHRRASAFLPQRMWHNIWYLSLWTLALFGIARMKLDKIRDASPWVFPLLACLLIFSGWGVWASSPRPAQKEAVLLGEEITARFEPHENATAHFALPGGSVVRVEETTRQWTRIRANENIGWVPSDSLSRLMPES